MNNTVLSVVKLSVNYFVRIHCFKLFDWFLPSNQITGSSEFVRNKGKTKASQ